LRGWLPHLSGVIAEHAAFLVAHPKTQLAAMPFAAA
jgi:hypothetical protein